MITEQPAHRGDAPCLKLARDRGNADGLRPTSPTDRLLNRNAEKYPHPRDRQVEPYRSPIA